eukprot:CAMPEP_0118670604 /NCGR_PEP_ID=MMETSP0785-20121206/21551_1 /TAXON_ID=91992 /ORGANISM="Bolidomonas pacifica, Strain CCMP 1866" /LENGTH=133 /DNA_ID=CAMNT_0006565421 /DNA_START=466 /DNA_END=865 /DNA_ORIENTATION=-
MNVTAVEIGEEGETSVSFCILPASSVELSFAQGALGGEKVKEVVEGGEVGGRGGGETEGTGEVKYSELRIRERPGRARFFSMMELRSVCGVVDLFIGFSTPGKNDAATDDALRCNVSVIGRESGSFDLKCIMI